LLEKRRVGRALRFGISNSYMRLNDFGKDII